jgi:hypothetical protein
MRMTFLLIILAVIVAVAGRALLEDKTTSDPVFWP